MHVRRASHGGGRPLNCGVRRHLKRSGTRMSDGVVWRGGFKGKKITFASRARVEEFAQIASEFMSEIFDLLQGAYAISDESDIRDFVEIGSSDTSKIWTRIKEVYGVDKSDVASGRLVDIFGEIARRRNPQ
jgi:hypothetical protein